MKDFYKILGVKEDASEEEIRERWVELTKLYHPDRGEDIASDEKIREINEAYQVLKHSSTRVEYDLKKAFNHKDRRRKGTVDFKRWGVPASILIILIIVGVIYIKNFETNQTDQIAPKNPVNSIDPTNSINPTNLTIQTDKPSWRPIVGSLPKPIDVPTKQSQVATATHAVRVKPRQPSQGPPRMSTEATIQRDSTKIIDSTTQRPDDVKAPITKLLNDQMTSSPTNSTNPINAMDPTDPINPIHPKIELAQFKPPSLLATEDEVKKFFNNYVNYYNRKDAKGILSLFSSKAIQNQKDGLEEIRKIYADFLSEDQEIRYFLHDMKIEIYQNAVEVKVRYEIEQIVKETGEKEVWRGPIRWVLIKEDGKLKILSMDYKYHRPL
jgi:hypothetical protein